MTTPHTWPDTEKRTRMTNPTVVLVHGAFTDATGWIGVISELRHCGTAVSR